MSYVSLARKYRPRRFVDMVGQESTTLALTNAIRLRREPHSVIFTGVRGIGKTTSARIYAKALNCEQGPTAEPCDVCASCQAITVGNHEDVLEIDGASNTGVDDVRALQETLSYVPQRSTYKIYIIDEVHMLSISAFNALLKTLEEPPQHVVFIFATTELHKVPETIQSRCQVFHLQKISRPVIAERIRAILHAEEIPFDEAALAIVAREGRGSMRDALTMLDQAIAVGGGQVSVDTLKNMVGGSQALPVLELLDGLLRKDAGLILEVIARWDQEGLAMAGLVEETAKACRNAFILRDLKGQSIDLQILELEDREQQMLLELGEKALPMDLNRLFRLLAKCLDDLRHADLDRYILENYCLEWCFDPGLPDLQTLMNVVSGGQALPPTPVARPAPTGDSSINLRDRWKTSAPAIKSPGSPPAPQTVASMPAPQAAAPQMAAPQKPATDNKRPWTSPAPSAPVQPSHTSVSTAAPSATPNASVSTAAPSATPNASVSTAAPSATPNTSVSTAAPSATPNASVSTAAPSATPNASVSTAAPSATPNASVSTAAPSATPNTSVSTAAPSATPNASVSTAAPSAMPKSTASSPVQSPTASMTAAPVPSANAPINQSSTPALPPTAPHMPVPPAQAAQSVNAPMNQPSKASTPAAPPTHTSINHASNTSTPAAPNPIPTAPRVSPPLAPLAQSANAPMNQPSTATAPRVSPPPASSANTSMNHPSNTSTPAAPNPVTPPPTASAQPTPARMPATAPRAGAMMDDEEEMPAWALAASMEQEVAKVEAAPQAPAPAKPESFLQQMARRAQAVAAATPPPPPMPKVETTPVAAPSSPSEPVWPENWRAFVDEWKKQKPLQGRVLEEAYMLEYTQQRIRLAVDPQSMAGGKLLQQDVRKRLMEQFAQLFGFKGVLEALPKADTNVENNETILTVKQRERDVAREQLKTRLEEHPMTREVISRFGGTIEQIELQ